jgi:hypothetical protein
LNQQVKLATATTLRYLPTEGKATSATVTIKDYANNDLVAPVSAATATIDSVSTTVDANSGPNLANPLKLSIASTSGIRVGGRYLLTDSYGRIEWVDVQAIAANDYVILRDSLVRDYTTGNTLVGTELSYNLTAANAQTSGGDCQRDYRCEWAYVVSGSTFVRETLYDVTRHPWYRTATIAGLKAWNSDLFSLFDREEGVTWEADLDAAFERVVERFDARGTDPAAIIGMEKLEVPTYCQLALQKAVAGIMPAYAMQDPMGYIDDREAALSKAFDVATANITWLDRNQDNVRAESESKPSLRIVRLIS